MIKFFRKIRQNLIIQNKTANYIKYAIGEILLVVIGILIALQLNQKAENKKTDKTRQEYYLQLLDDLHKDIQLANETIGHFEIDLKMYDDYLKLYEGPELTPTQVYEHLLSLRVQSLTISFNSNTIESLRSSGEIILIPLEIRNKLIDLLRFQDDFLKNVDINYSGKNNMLQDLGIYRGASTLDRRLAHQPKLRGYLQFDENLPQIILGLDAVQRWKSFSESGSITRLKVMIENIEAIITSIQLEIKA